MGHGIPGKLEKLVLLSLMLVTVIAKAQTSEIAGVYHAGPYSPPSPMFLALNCDSTYYFITHWDAGTPRESIYPQLSAKRKWRIDKTSKEILLDSPVYKIGIFHVTDTGTLVSKARRQRITWIKVITYDNACLARICVTFHNYSNRTVYTLEPGLQVLRSEEFKNNILLARTTYYRLSEEETKGLGLTLLKDSYVQRDGGPDKAHHLRMQIEMCTYSWPIERTEKLTEYGWEVVTYDIYGKLIKQETTAAPQN